MALPIIEQIIAEVVTALEGVTVINGYQIDVAEVYRPLTIAGTGRSSPGSFTVQLTMDDPQRDPGIDISGNPPVIGWNQPLALDLIYRPADNSTVPIEQQLNIFWADVQKALYVDPLWTGLAHDTKLGDPLFWIDQPAGETGCTVVVMIQYRVKENDPYTKYNA